MHLHIWRKNWSTVKNPKFIIAYSEYEFTSLPIEPSLCGSYPGAEKVRSRFVLRILAKFTIMASTYLAILDTGSIENR